MDRQSRLTANTVAERLPWQAVEGGIWHRIFAAMADDGDFEYLIVDSTIVRAHQHAAGAKRHVLVLAR